MRFAIDKSAVNARKLLIILEKFWPDHHLAKVEVASSSLVSRSNFNDLRELNITLFRCAEHLLDMVEVPGSNPCDPTKSKTYRG